MTLHHHAPGLPANWLNAWLAAIGVTVLLDDVRLAWTETPTPTAVFHTDDYGDLATRLADAIPTVDDLATLAISRSHQSSPVSFNRKLDRAAFAARARVARDEGDFTLASTVTDLADPNDSGLHHSPFDPPVPKGLTLHDRLTDCRTALDIDGPNAFAATLDGTATRVKLNGLGFDYRRILHSAEPTGEKWADPAIELLAFYSLILFPVRGDGHSALTRGWTGPAGRPGSLTWPAWGPPLRLAAIDAILDRHWSNQFDPDVVAIYRSVPYRKLGSADTTTGYGSEPAP